MASLIFSGLFTSACAMDNGVARTPPMGWMSWERYRCEVDCTTYPNDCINDRLYMDMADRLAEDGWKELGYEYVNVDDCWSNDKREPDGTLQGNTTRFPKGMVALGDYIHKRGLKFGLYTDAGSHTCGGYPGSRGYMDIDAQTYAKWGVDSIKVDGCYIDEESDYRPLYTEFSTQLNLTGRPMVYWCSWPAYVGNTAPYQYIASICNGWRPYGDIQDSWASVLSIINWWAVNQPLLQPAAGPGAWNDPDMLIIGDFALSLDQSRVQMAIWSIVAAPLLMSNDLRNIDKSYVEILQNKEIIGVNQDPLGLQGGLVASGKKVQWWTRALSRNRTALVIWSSSTAGTTFKVDTQFAALGDTRACGKPPAVAVRDIFAHENVGVFQSGFTTTVNPNGARMFVLNCSITPIPPIPPHPGALIENDPCGYAYNSYQQWNLTSTKPGKAGQVKLVSNQELCLTSQGSEATLEACKDGSDQLWTLRSSKANAAIFNVLDGRGLCLDLTMSDGSPGAQIGIYGCGTDQTNQLWQLDQSGSWLQSKLNGYCVSVSSAPLAKHHGVQVHVPLPPAQSADPAGPAGASSSGLVAPQPRSQPRYGSAAQSTPRQVPQWATDAREL